jgi:hypothetical protein
VTGCTHASLRHSSVNTSYTWCSGKTPPDHSPPKTCTHPWETTPAWVQLHLIDQDRYRDIGKSQSTWHFHPEWLDQNRRDIYR